MLPTTISRFRNGGDDKTADLLESVVYPEEITHCAAGVRWFKFLCSRSTDTEEAGSRGSDPGEADHNRKEESEGGGGGEVIKRFHAIVRAFFKGTLKPPFNEDARKAAGFGPQWYEPLSIKKPTF